MDHPLTIELARQLFPQQVYTFSNAFRTRKTQNPKASRDPSILTWTVSRAVQVSGYSARDLFSGRAAQDHERRAAMSLEARVEDEVKRSHCVLTAQAQHWKRSVEIPVPEYVKQDIRRRLEKEIADQRAVDSLSPEDRQKQVQNILSELSKDPGFVVIKP